MQAAIDFMNKLNSKDTVTKSKCSVLTLHNIIGASKQMPNKVVQQFMNTEKNNLCDSCVVKVDKNIDLKKHIYEVVFTVKPSEGEYEAQVEVNDKNEMIVYPGISRLNKYGDQASCVAKDFPHLRKYCFCYT